MNRNLVARFVLQLQDRASAGIGALQRRLMALRSVAGRVGLGLGVLGGLSFAGPVRQAAAFEGTLRDIAVTAGQSGAAVDAAVNQQRDRLQALARQYRELTSSLLPGLQVLVSRGTDASLLDGYLENLALVRSASNGASDDLAQLAVTMERTSRITDAAGQRQGFAEMFRAGQLGGAELSDMARYLPGILTQLDGLGVRGQRGVQNAATWFQVLRDGFGTVPETAAAYSAMLGQILSADFRKHAADQLNLDIMAIFNDASRRQARGEDIDPVEAIMARIGQQTQGRRERLFETIQDQNARQAIMTATTREGRARYVDIRRQVREARPEVLTQASSDRQQGLSAETRRGDEGVVRLGDQLGNAFAPILTVLNGHLERFVDLLKQFEADNPGVLAQVVSAVGVFGGLVAALGAVGLAMGPVAAGAGLAAQGIALLLSPIGLLVAAMVGAAVYIYLEWERFRAFFVQMWAGIQATAAGAIAFFGGLFSGDLARQMAGLRQVFEGLDSFFSGFWSTIKTLFQDFDGWLGGFFTGLGDVFGSFTAWLANWIGSALTNAVVGFRAPFDALTSWFAGLWAGMPAPFGAFTAWLAGWVAGALAGAVAAFRAPFDALTSWFAGLWAGMPAPFATFTTWLAGWVAGALAGAVAAFRAPFDALTSWFSGLWAGMGAPFDSFIGGIVASIERAIAAWERLRGAFSAGQAAAATADAAGPALGSVQERQRQAAQSRALLYGGGEAGGARAAQAPISGEIVVRAAPGSEIVAAEGTNRNVPITTGGADRGATRSRP